MSYFQNELKKLLSNDKQRTAYLCQDHCVVQAGPGSGKTATLSLKIMKLLGEISTPRGLGCITFNNEAVREFKSRLKKLGFQPRQNVFLGTVHAFCLANVIKPFAKLFYPELQYPIKVASDSVRDSYLEQAMNDLNINERVGQLRTRFDKYRHTHVDRDDRSWNGDDQETAGVIEKYETRLHAGGYLDFDDLILMSLRLIETSEFVRSCLEARFPWLIVDEYQDLGYPLHRIVTSLMANTKIKIFAVGDPDQSIYGFTGADPKYLKELADRSDTTGVTLELNYRCGQKIIDGSQTILSPEEIRNYKSNRDQAEPGEILFVESKDGLSDQANIVAKKIIPELQAAGYELKNIAILVADKNDANVVAEALSQNDIPYAGEKDQRYKRTPLIRWLEDIAQWSCNSGEVYFKDLFNFWANKFHLENFNNPAKRLTSLGDFFNAINKFSKPEIKLSEWLNNLSEVLGLDVKLNGLTDQPEEKEAFDNLLAACGDDEPLKNFTLADFGGCGVNTQSVQLNTMHSSKGLEFDAVIIPGLEEGRLPSWGATSSDQIKEARRTFYVAVTRARHLVYLLYSGWYQNKYGTRFEKGPSSFLVELQDKFKKKEQIPIGVATP